MVVEAKKGTAYTRSDVKQVTAKESPVAQSKQLTLTVTSIPAGIYTAKLYTEYTLGASPVATSTIFSGSIFRFIDASSSTDAFTQAGEYYIILEQGTHTRAILVLWKKPASGQQLLLRGTNLSSKRRNGFPIAVAEEHGVFDTKVIFYSVPSAVNFQSRSMSTS